MIFFMKEIFEEILKESAKQFVEEFSLGIHKFILKGRFSEETHKEIFERISRGFFKVVLDDVQIITINNF